MHISQDFARMHSSWTKTFPEEKPFDTTKSLPYVIHPAPVVTEQQQPKKTVTTRKFSARVALFSGAAQDKAAAAGADHLSYMLQLVLSKRPKQGLTLFGGAWSEELDGGDPNTEPDALIRTAARTMKEQVGVDLSKSTWMEFIRIEYHRPAEKYKGKSYPEQRETAVVYVPNVADHLPTLAEAMACWQALDTKRIAELSKVLPDKDEFGRDIRIAEVQEYRKANGLLKEPEPPPVAAAPPAAAQPSEPAKDEASEGKADAGDSMQVEESGEGKDLEKESSAEMDIAGQPAAAETADALPLAPATADKAASEAGAEPATPAAVEPAEGTGAAAVVPGSEPAAKAGEVVAPAPAPPPAPVFVTVVPDSVPALLAKAAPKPAVAGLYIAAQHASGAGPRNMDYPTTIWP